MFKINPKVLLPRKNVVDKTFAQHKQDHGYFISARTESNKVQLRPEFRVQKSRLTMVYHLPDTRSISYQIIGDLENVGGEPNLSTTLEGLYPAVYSPFDSKGQLNVSVIPAYAEHLKNNGVDGVLVAGTSGEGPSLTLDERKALVEAWTKEGKIRGLKVVMQVGGQNLPDVLNLAAFAEKAGTDAILTLPELYFKPKNDKENVKYLKKVSEAAPTQPIMYYHHPTMSGVNIKPKEFFKEAVATIPNFKGMKCDFGTALALMSSGLLQKEHALFMTSHVTMSSNVMMGINSSMTAITSIFPKTMVEIARAVKSGNLQKARLKQIELNERADAITSLGDYVIFSKVAMNLVNKINVGSARHARDSITKEQTNTLLMNLAAIDAKYASLDTQKSFGDR